MTDIEISGEKYRSSLTIDDKGRWYTSCSDYYYDDGREFTFTEIVLLKELFTELYNSKQPYDSHLEEGLLNGYFDGTWKEDKKHTSLTYKVRRMDDPKIRMYVVDLINRGRFNVTLTSEGNDVYITIRNSEIRDNDD